MSRLVPGLSSALAAVLTTASLVAAGLQATPTPAAAAIDPNDPALVLSDKDPCTAPCVQSGVVYRTTTSKLNAAAGTEQLKLDLFRSSKTPKKDAPVVVVAHGGGFVEGDRTMMTLVAETLARSGFLVASIDYRLADPARNSGQGIVAQADLVPAAEEASQDMLASLAFIRKHAKAYGATTDRSRYAVGGYSAGAIAALRLAIRGGDTLTPKSRRFKVGAAFSISGTECGTWSVKLGCKPVYDEADPPIEMFHGEADSIVSFSFARDTCTAAVLRGGGCQGYFYPDQDHFWSSGTIFGGGKGLTKKHPAVLPTVAKFLRRELK